MLFNSLDFMIFYPVVLVVYHILPGRTRYIWLLAVSYYFYMGWNPKYAALIACSTLITYVCCLIIERWSHNGQIKKAVMLINLMANLSILFFFKYFDFVIENINAKIQKQIEQEI